MKGKEINLVNKEKIFTCGKCDKKVSQVRRVCKRDPVNVSNTYKWFCNKCIKND